MPVGAAGHRVVGVAVEAVAVRVPPVDHDLVAGRVRIARAAAVEPHRREAVAHRTRGVGATGLGHRRVVLQVDRDPDGRVAVAAARVGHPQRGRHDDVAVRVGQRHHRLGEALAHRVIELPVAVQVPGVGHQREALVDRAVRRRALAAEGHLLLAVRPVRAGRRHRSRPRHHAQRRYAVARHTEAIRHPHLDRELAHGVDAQGRQLLRRQVRLRPVPVEGAVVVHIPLIADDGVAAGRVGVQRARRAQRQRIAQRDRVGPADGSVAVAEATGLRHRRAVALVDVHLDGRGAHVAVAVLDLQAHHRRAAERELREGVVDHLALRVVVGPVVVQVPAPVDHVHARVAVVRAAGVQRHPRPARRRVRVRRRQRRRVHRVHRQRRVVLTRELRRVLDLQPHVVDAGRVHPERGELLRRQIELRLGGVAVGVLNDTVGAEARRLVVAEIPAIEAQVVAELLGVRVEGLRRVESQALAQQDVVGLLGRIGRIGVRRRRGRRHAVVHVIVDRARAARRVRHPQRDGHLRDVVRPRDRREHLHEVRHRLVRDLEGAVVIQVPVVAHHVDARHRRAALAPVELRVREARHQVDRRGIGPLNHRRHRHRAEDRHDGRHGRALPEGVGHPQRDRVARQPGRPVRRPVHRRRQHVPSHRRLDARRVLRAAEGAVAVDVPLVADDAVAAVRVGVR